MRLVASKPDTTERSGRGRRPDRVGATPPTATLLTATLLTAVIVAAGLVGLPSPSDSQVTVRGQVLDEVTRRPIEGAAVTLVEAGGDDFATELSDGAGEVTIVVDDGISTVRLRAERIGYGDVLSRRFRLDGYRSVDLEIRMSPGAVPVPSLEIVARQRRETSPVHEGFEHRRERGFGEYITRDEIERRRPARVTDLLRTMSGVRLSRSGRGNRPVVTAGRANSFGGSCPAQIYVDDFHLNRADGRTFRIDEAVSPEEVHGIEVYRGLSSVPAEFLSPEADCGVIVIWTRRGPD